MLAEVRKAFTDHREIFLITLLFIAVNSLLMAFEIFWFVSVPFILILTYFALKALDRFVLLIVFFTPVSVPLEYYYPQLGFNLQLITEPLLIVVLLLFSYRIILERRFDRSILLHPVSGVIYFQLVWIFMTSITSTMPLVSFKFLVSRLWFLIAFYFLAAAMFQRKSMIRKYLWMYIPAMIVVIIYAFLNLAANGFLSQKAAHLAASPFFKDHTSYGAVLAMLIPVVTGLATLTRYPLPVRILCWIVLLFLVAALIFSYTRAAWLSVIAACGIYVMVKLRISWRLTGLFLLLAGCILFFYRSELFLKLEQNRQDSSKDFAKHIESISNIRTDASNLERINRWNSAVRMFKEKPVTGWGPGTYMFQYAPFQASHEKTIISTNIGDWGNAHSEYIGPLAESGLPGFIIMLALVMISLFTGFKVYYASEIHSQERVLSLALTLGLITYYLHGIVNNFLDTDKASALVWGYTAMLVAMDIRQKNLTPAENKSDSDVT